MYDPTSTRVSRANSFANSFYDAGEAYDLGTPPLESTSEFRVIEKKKRGARPSKKKPKGPAADLAISDTATESSRAPSPTPATSPLKSIEKSILEIAINELIGVEPPTAQAVISVPLLSEAAGNAKSAVRGCSNLMLESDPTPIQPRFDHTNLVDDPTFGSLTDIDPAFVDLSDTQLTKDRSKRAMSQLTNALRGGNLNLDAHDAFDSEEWDPELPSIDDTDSPKPLQFKPQPIAYTTVGSRVDPNAKPHFSAPNRIQREGASRQPLLSMMNSQQRPSYNSYLHGPNGAPAPLIMANSMAYAQSFQSPKSPAGPTQSATPPETSNRPTRMAASHKMPPLTDKEAEILKNVQYSKLMSGNTNGSPDKENTPSISKLSVFAPTFENKDVMVERVRSSGNAKDLPLGSSLMGETPRKFTGTAMAVVKAKKAAAESARNAEIIAGLSSFDNGFSELLATAVGRGNLDREFQFPPTLQSSQTRQSNPLFGAQSSLASQPTTARGPPLGVRGYPQPLTAGPPGQRQVPRVFPQPTASTLESIWGQKAPSYANTANAYAKQASGAYPEMSPIWQNALQPPHGNVYTSGVAQHPASILISSPPPVPSYDHLSRAAPLCDSLPPEAVLKYYPYGIPQDMNGTYRCLSAEKQKVLDEAHFNQAQKAAQEAKDLDDTFYHGQRRYATMDGADYVQELEERESARKNFGPIAPPQKLFPPGPAIKKLITKEDMEKMTAAEAALPCVEAVFGTLLAYADTAACSRRHLSKFTEPANWQIDNSEEGNKSMFGEDWGRPPKRFGRDSRRQGDF